MVQKPVSPWLALYLLAKGPIGEFLFSVGEDSLTFIPLSPPLKISSDFTA